MRGAGRSRCGFTSTVRPAEPLLAWVAGSLDMPPAFTVAADATATPAPDATPTPHGFILPPNTGSGWAVVGPSAWLVAVGGLAGVGALVFAVGLLRRSGVRAG